jgi:cation/acetate symporter
MPSPSPADPRGIGHQRRNNFLALVFCLMFGTAALPHILMRAYTTPSVHETRVSVFWTLFFILLIYLTMPALAVLAKYDIYTSLVGSGFDTLPTWVSYWANVDKANPLISIADINGDGIVQLAEIAIDGDVLTLATPEIGGLPYVISGLVAAGGLAAALSTADGLLLAISNALSHDIYYKIVDPGASTQKRVTISKLLLLAVAFIAAYAASQKPADILSLVGAAFSLAASTLFPALVAGRVLEARQPPGRDRRHAGRLPGLRLLHAAHQSDPGRERGRRLVPHRADLGRRVRGAGGAGRAGRGQPADAGAAARDRAGRLTSGRRNSV